MSESKLERDLAGQLDLLSRSGAVWTGWRGIANGSAH